MKIKELLNQYKSISKEMRQEAQNYNYLALAVRNHYCTKETFEEYNKSWARLINMNEKAYNIMYDYRTLCNTVIYRFLFFVGAMPKQNTFRFVDDSKTEFRCTLLINLLNLK